MLPLFAVTLAIFLTLTEKFELLAVWVKELCSNDSRGVWNVSCTLHSPQSGIFLGCPCLAGMLLRL